MNYYERHIGDYLKDTAHLSLLEHGVYTRLMDVYYTRESAIPASEAARLIGARSKDEREALQAVLSEFFVLIDGAWNQKRCDEELMAYRESQEGAEDKKLNDKERQRRARERRKALFEQLRSHGVVPPWDTKTGDLQQMLSRVTQTQPSAPVTQPVTRDNTATQTPDTSNQYPDTTTSLRSVVTPGVEQALSGGTTTVGEKTAETAAADAASTPPATRGTRLPDDWALPKAWGEWALAEYPLWTPAKVRLEGQKFRDHWTALSGKAATKANWQATWRNWCRSDIARMRPGVRGKVLA